MAITGLPEKTIIETIEEKSIRKGSEGFLKRKAKKPVTEEGIGGGIASVVL